MLAIILRISLHITLTLLVAAMFYFHVWRYRKELQDEELRENMWQVTVVTICLCIALVVVAMFIR